mmetsp:Transcript_28454/g.50092  ORF Transcript_28454/g.50092 Transcript_28454/m.50092 type:complete len:607 (+) Transcript_28454:159-1979(+)|eukprot:CAMPEP_0197525410 /NCGR_PEP_ID=MMETSP1318-20131121/11903_1 /TAXON_ID=552666 /ORGANISM="Partenskyella glossopodia, Strain RCC365" /LENGTH=606 /DNA_ID=CAMNT_0043078791 /DNA_START=125 /DNA_END=1945 /DNA_ORIENTATION=-
MNPRHLKEMFPAIDLDVIEAVVAQHRGNQEKVLSALFQMTPKDTTTIKRVKQKLKLFQQKHWQVVAPRGLNIRELPSMSIAVPILGALRPGEYIEEIEARETKLGKLWVRHTRGWSLATRKGEIGMRRVKNPYAHVDIHDIIGSDSQQQQQVAPTSSRRGSLKTTKKKKKKKSHSHPQDDAKENAYRGDKDPFAAAARRSSTDPFADAARRSVSTSGPPQTIQQMAGISDTDDPFARAARRSSGQNTSAAAADPFVMAARGSMPNSSSADPFAAAAAKPHHQPAGYVQPRQPQYVPSASPYVTPAPVAPRRDSYTYTAPNPGNAAQMMGNLSISSSNGPRPPSREGNENKSNKSAVNTPPVRRRRRRGSQPKQQQQQAKQAFSRPTVEIPNNSGEGAFNVSSVFSSQGQAGHKESNVLNGLTPTTSADLSKMFDDHVEADMPPETEVAGDQGNDILSKVMEETEVPGEVEEKKSDMKINLWGEDLLNLDDLTQDRVEKKPKRLSLRQIRGETIDVGPPQPAGPPKGLKAPSDNSDVFFKGVDPFASPRAGYEPNNMQLMVVPQGPGGGYGGGYGGYPGHGGNGYGYGYYGYNYGGYGQQQYGGYGY